jgi:hypothetical protein
MAPAQDGVCARAGIAGRATDDLLHFAFLQVNARSKHVRKLKFHVRSSKLTGSSNRARPGTATNL